MRLENLCDTWVIRMDRGGSGIYGRGPVVALLIVAFQPDHEKSISTVAFAAGEICSCR